ncbi:hypothetical protein JK386_16135 [Nocardioides sp. zg-536]|uniref:DUF3558 domain-containing protein n=1 Tax=Nocardioides faecalis TaxID=2803858 RepID=A0A938Y7C3_9ACTN|nr:hypothetical protein [Nocardioides faecalis]MBM9461433.1 hypothetical protein [Nocardioides faecalis]MBS4751761.1 hypothetical protein [Nocardioides faecalis]QVI59377.1 hypothetical protein KG111_03125 [Nocardioides faecalis]
MRPTTFVRAAAAVAAVGALSACSNLGLSKPSATETVTVQADPATPTTAAPAAPAPSATASAGFDFDLLYVDSNAPACDSIWRIGSLLPQDYEWCADAEGNPVAGVRIGSCEVVTYNNQFYAIPGRQIEAASGVITSDPRYLAALTSCKRRPFPPQ